jgi:hypothetical protein
MVILSGFMRGLSRVSCAVERLLLSDAEFKFSVVP